MEDISKEVGEVATYKISPTSDDGAARDVQTINWSNTGVGNMTVADDKLSATVTSDVVGDANVQVIADADLTDAGEVLLTDSGITHFTAKPIPQATKLNLSAE